MIKVSIIAPVYNADAFLNKMLGSLIAQTLKDIEIICIDDGSTDDSLSILEAYAETDPRIKIIKQENQGQGCAKNNALKQAQGEYIGFIDSDDWVNNKYFEILYTNAKKYDADISATCDVEEVYERCTKQKGVGFDKKAKFLNSIEERSAIILSTGIAVNKIYKRTLLEKNNILFSGNRAIGEDNLFNIPAIINANLICTTNKSTYYYRQRTDSSVHTLSSKDLGVVSIYREIINKLNDEQKATWGTVIKNRMFEDFIRIYKTFDFERKDQFAALIDIQFPDIDFAKHIEKFNTGAIISLTSYPARIHTVHETIKTLLRQSYKAEFVVLWLAEEQFPNKENDLPKELRELQSRFFKILWCEDIRSYKKLIPALQKYPEHVIVTADDDAYYANNWLETLFEAYSKNPGMIHGHRGHRITLKNKQVIPYSQWILEVKTSPPSYLNFLTGVGGILYPAGILYKDVLRQDLFIKFCSHTDDIWFWAMAVLNGIKINIVENSISNVNLVPDTQEVALYHDNMLNGNNDVSLKNVFGHYPVLLDILIKEDENHPFIEKPHHKVVHILGLKIKFRTKNHPYYASPIEQIFSIRNEGIHKVVRFCGLKIKMRRKKRI